MNNNVIYLKEVILRIQKRIKKFIKESQTLSEEETKIVLINPILRGLGWDIENIDEVKFEYRRKPKDNPVDYCILIDNKPKLFIEAKSLKRSLEEYVWITQTVNYANNAGVKWCVLTNGDEYRIYKTNAEGPVENKLFKTVKLSEIDGDESKINHIIQVLNLLSKKELPENTIENEWEREHVDLYVKGALEEIFNKKSQKLLNLIKRYLEKNELKYSNKDIKDSLERLEIQIQIPTIFKKPPIKIDESEWDYEDIKKYFDNCRNKHIPTYTYFKVLSDSEGIVSRENLLRKIGRYGLSGIFVGLNAITKRKKKECLDWKDKDKRPMKFSINPKYKKLVKDYFLNEKEVSLNIFSNIESILKDKSKNLKEIFYHLNNKIKEISPEIEVIPVSKHRVNLKSNINFTEVAFRKDHILCILKLSEINDPQKKSFKRWVRDKCKWKFGYRIRNLTDIEYVISLIKQAYKNSLK